MSIPTVTITGNVLPPNNVAAGGTVSFELNTVAVDLGSGVVVPRKVSTPILSGGAISQAIWPNAAGEGPSRYSVYLEMIPALDGDCPVRIKLGEIVIPVSPSSQDIGALIAAGSAATGGAALLEFQFANRAALVAKVASGLVPIPGFTYLAGGLGYLGKTGATDIPDLPGLVPAPLVASIAWDDVTDKPATFPPSAHTHPVSAISDSTAAGRAMVTAADAAAQRTLLSVETTTQLNARDTANRARSNHTGEQEIGTVTGLQTALDALEEKDTLTNAKLKVNVVDFLEGRTDQEAFQAAVDSLPTASTFPHTLNTGELPTYEIVVPAKPAGLSNDAGAAYHLPNAINVGGRDVIWRLDEGARLGASNNSGQQLNGKVVRADGIHMAGFANKRKRTNLTLTQFAAATSYDGMQAKISAYDADTVATQAFQHERGAANAYAAIHDNTEIKRSGSGVTYTATSVAFATPLTVADTNKLRIGMLVDTVGNMLTGSPVRHTTRITAINKNGSGECTSLTVETWHRMVADPPFTAAVASTPADGTGLVINPVNKLWTMNANVFLQKTDGATYGYTSGSVFEAGIWNQTGARAGTEFDRDTHPFHVWGLDMPHLGAHGGGVAYIVRGQQTWDRAFENRSAEIGFHNHGTQFNDGKMAFVSSSGFDGAYAGWGTGTPAYDFLARSRIGEVWDNQFAVVGGVPTVELGRKGSASTPRLRFYADGLAGSDSALWDAEIATTSTNGGTLILDAKHDTIMRWNGADRLRVTSTGVSIAGLVTGGAVTQSSTDATASRLLKVGDFGIGGIVPLVGNISVTNNTIAPGFYRYSTVEGSTGGPTGVLEGHLWHSRRTNGGGETQLLIAESVSSGSASVVWLRVRGSGAWSPWRMSYGQGNTVGTVSQSGGVPTGAVIESGTGPNGTYVKFADGTVMCWIDNIIEQNLAADTYVEVTWTLPVVMLTSPMYHVGTTVHSFNDAAGRENALRWLKSSGVAVGGTAPVISCYNSKTSTVAVRVDAFAIGRWF